MRTSFPRPDLKGGDERGALPSASRYDQVWACPPSFTHSLLVEVTYAEKVITGAVQGTLNHHYLASGQEPGVQERDLEALEALKRRAQRFSEQAFAQEGARRVGEKLVEERLWIWRNPLAKRNGGAREFVGSGKADEVWLSEDRRLAVVNDYKTLFGRHKQAPQSGQIYALAGILKANLPELEVVYGGVHSRANPETTPARFSQSVLEGVAEDVASTFERAIVENHENEPAKRAGAECGFCPAASVCQTFALNLRESLNEVNRLSQRKDANEMSLDELERLLRYKENLEVATKVMNQAEQRALHLIQQEGQHSEALEVVPGRKYTKLDQGLLYQSLVEQHPHHKGEIDEFWRRHGSLSVEQARKLTGKLLQTDLNQFEGKGMEVLKRAPSIRFKM
jgi:hypothetical protein